MTETGYDREAALIYARDWALRRNPDYMDFHRLGGDCTNFASQCLYAGCGVMNRARHLGWYYVSASNRAPAWSGVHFYFEFLMENTGAGPYGELAEEDSLLPGDFIQLSDSNRYHHTLIVTERRDGRLYVATHTIDCYDRPLESYVYEKKRCLHVAGYRGK